MGTEAFLEGDKQPWQEFESLPQSIAQDKNAWSYTSILPHTSSWRGTFLKKPQFEFYFKQHSV
jgi:hypothetical protein